MIERKFEATEGAESVNFSHGAFGFVVQSLHNPAGKRLLSAKIVEYQFAVPYVLTFLRKPFNNSGIYNSPAWAGKFLDDWCPQVMRSRIEPMKKIARSVRQQWVSSPKRHAERPSEN